MLDSYWLAEQEVNQRIESAEDWKLKGKKIYARASINAGYDSIRRFKKEMYRIKLEDYDSIQAYFDEREKIKKFAKSLKIKLGKAIEDIAK